MAMAVALTATVPMLTRGLLDLTSVVAVVLVLWTVRTWPFAAFAPFTSASSALRVTPRSHLAALSRDLALASQGDAARGRVLGVPVHLRASADGVHVRLDLDGHRLQLGPTGRGHRLGAWHLNSPPRTLDDLPHDLLAARSSATWAVWSGALSTVSARPVSSADVGLSQILDMIHLAAVLRGDGAQFWQRLAAAESLPLDSRTHALTRALAEPPSDATDRTWRAALDTDLRPSALEAARAPWGLRHRDTLRAEVDRGASLDTPHLLLALAAHASRDDVARLGDALARADSLGARAALSALERLGDADAIDAIDVARRRWTGPLAAAAAETRAALVNGARRLDGGRLTQATEGGALSLPGTGRDA